MINLFIIWKGYSFKFSKLFNVLLQWTYFYSKMFVYQELLEAQRLKELEEKHRRDEEERKRREEEEAKDDELTLKVSLLSYLV